MAQDDRFSRQVAAHEVGQIFGQINYGMRIGMGGIAVITKIESINGRDIGEVSGGADPVFRGAEEAVQNDQLNRTGADFYMMEIHAGPESIRRLC
jgi:hypothetical protein